MTNKLLALSLVSMAACVDAGGDAPTDDVAPGSTTTAPADVPVATFTSTAGSTIDIYADGPHSFSALETAGPGVGHMLENIDRGSTSAVDLYRALTGETDAPAALVALDARVGVVSVAHEARRGDRKATPMSAAGNCTANYVQSHYSYCQGSRTNENTFCLLNWWNGAYEYAGDTVQSEASICAASGQVLWQITNGDGGFHQFSVLEGQFYNYTFYDSGGDWVHYDVLQAKNNEFNFAGNFWHD